MILVLFSGTFLISSYFSYIFHSLSLLLSQSSPHFAPPFPYILGFLLFFVAAVLLLEFCCGPRSRRCRNPTCKGLKKAMEFDLQLQTDDCVRSGVADDIDRLPWKGGSEANPDYECLRAELRKMAPPNGRAVLLFRARCGCPVAKLEGWGPKRGRKHKNVSSKEIKSEDLAADTFEQPLMFSIWLYTTRRDLPYNVQFSRVMKNIETFNPFELACRGLSELRSDIISAGLTEENLFPVWLKLLCYCPGRLLFVKYFVAFVDNFRLMTMKLVIPLRFYGADITNCLSNRVDKALSNLAPNGGDHR
ncbi:hypothetical protein JRO89_XS03G0195600 [Xanthoceras sorbifolium]|uniref:Ribosomal protein L34e superfamily protein n=1 Tax=Xanthoceras sorbifolium TaxID=99658 RepID=A0ABQ8IB93_9ROSI|nr:hypothetical protein JRO89_XS03G0195600 [Xanthoceras sorbifolium]